MTDTVSFEVRDGVAILTVDRPPVNAIDVSVRAGVVRGIDEAEARGDVHAVVLACAGRTFLSGADLGELSGEIRQPDYHTTLARIEGCSKPVVAALFGTALGGGLETAMACHYRVAARDARVGMPEINLGIIPGAGGTQRLPRLIGAQAALDMMVQGGLVPADKARDIGLVDEVVDGDVTEGAVAFARSLVAKKAPVRPTSQLPVVTDGFDPAEVLAKYARNLKGRTTQHDLVKLVEIAARTPFAEGLPQEIEISAASVKSPEGRALVHVFFAERETGRIPGLSPDIKAGPIAKAAVVGAGTMGSGIAAAFADSKIPTVLIDVEEAGLQRGLASIRANYETSVKRGRLQPADVEARMALITGALSIDACAEADVIVEAVFENMDLKKTVVAQIDKVAKPGALIGTNTSSLSVTEIAAATSRPADVVGLHFFVPANVMRLLEIVRGEQTSSQSLVAALEVAKKLRKIGVVVGDGFGFVGNRMMLDGFWREAEQLMLEGASPLQVDNAVEAFGFGMGPGRVNDMAGVDVGTKARIELLKREARPDPYHVISDTLTGLGRIGQKSGRGVYRYEPGDRTAHPDPETIALIESLAAERGIARRTDITDQEIQERCVLSLINVGAQILHEGGAYRASDIDVIWTSGYGFPRWRGGPMFYADELGLKSVYARVSALHQRLGHYWKPSDLLRELAESGKSFADWDSTRR